VITLSRDVLKCVTYDVVQYEFKGAEQEVIMDSQRKVFIINASSNTSQVHYCSTDNMLNGELHYYKTTSSL
jgi:hypothetical protein